MTQVHAPGRPNRWVRRCIAVGIVLVMMGMAACQRVAVPSKQSGYPANASSTTSDANDTNESSSKSSGVPSMRVTLEVFSGRPNPAWELTSSQADEFTRRVAALTTSTTGAPLAGLGYQGLNVLPTGLSVGFDGVTVYAGLVVVTRTGKTQNLNDPGRELELWLLETGRPYIDKALFDDIKKQMR